MPRYKTPSHKVSLDLYGEMVLKMDLKEARGLWVDDQIFKLQSQMAMVHRSLVKLGKVTSMDGRNPYYHSMFPTDQGMSSSSPKQSEHFKEVELFPCSHEEENESYVNLFHDEQVLSPMSVQFDPNSLPIFDSYEQEDELHEAKPPIYDDLNSLGLLSSHSYADYDVVAAPKGLKLLNAHLNFAKHDPPLYWKSFFAQGYSIPSVERLRQPRENSFKNCYLFTKEGVHSVQIFLEVAEFKPGVQRRMIISGFAAPCSSVQSWIAQGGAAQELPSTTGSLLTAFMGPNTHGPGLLDINIEDDELKDGEEIFSSLKLQDLRSNLQQPGVFDAGASRPCMNQEA